MVTVVYATANGSIGMIRSLTADQYELLSRIQANMLSVVKSIGNFDHRAWRMFRNTTKTGEMRQFIDGDLVENYLKLTDSEKRKVVHGGEGVEALPLTVDETEALVSSLRG